MGQGAPPPCIPIVPVGTRLCPSRAVNTGHHQRWSRESSMESRNCHLLCPTHRDSGEGLGPQPLSNSPYCYGQSSRAAGRDSGLRRFGTGDEDVSEAKDPPSEGGLMSLGRGKEGAAVSGQPGRWCQQRRGWHQQGGELCSCPRANTVHSRASRPLLSPEPRLNKLVTAPAAGTGESYWENWRNKQNPPACPLASCVGWPAPGR